MPIPLGKGRRDSPVSPQRGHLLPLQRWSFPGAVAGANALGIALGIALGRSTSCWVCLGV